MEILDRIKSVEGKIDSLSVRGAFLTSTATHAQMEPRTLSPAPVISAASGVPGSTLSFAPFQLQEAPSASSGGEEQYKYVSSVHQMLGWPAMQQLLSTLQPKITAFDITSVGQGSPTATLHFWNPTHQTLPTNTTFTSLRPRSAASVHTSAPSSVTIPISGLSWETVQRLSKAYFESFNLLFPLVDHHSFISNTMPSAFNEGFSQGMGCTVSLLVLALGEMSLAGAEGLPIHVNNGRPSGVKGGSKDQPPGLELFNEARKRMGFNLTECSLENVQVFALAR